MSGMGEATYFNPDFQQDLSLLKIYITKSL